MINKVNPVILFSFPVVGLCPQDALAAGALDAIPFYENLANLASFVAQGIVAAPPILGGLIPSAQVLACHASSSVSTSTS